MSTHFEIKVPGTDFIIKPDTIYTVLPKSDPNAPDGFKEHGTTKVIHPDVGTTIGAPYDSDMEVWDTGFYEFSPCLNGMPKEELAKHLEVTKAFLVDPIEKIKGRGILEHNVGNKFFDSYAITLANKVSFNSNNPTERLALYFAVLAKELAPKDNVGHPSFKQAAYQVVNREVEINAKEQITIDNGKAIGEFYSLLKSDRPKLQKILKYLRISDTAIEDEGTFITIFHRFLEDKQDGYRNSKIFLQHLDKFNTEAGEEELHLFQMIHDLYTAGQVKLIKSEYYLRDINLGNSIKHAAMLAAVSPEIKKIIVELTAQADEE